MQQKNELWVHDISGLLTFVFPIIAERFNKVGFPIHVDISQFLYWEICYYIEKYTNNCVVSFNRREPSCYSLHIELENELKNLFCDYLKTPPHWPFSWLNVRVEYSTLIVERINEQLTEYKL